MSLNVRICDLRLDQLDPFLNYLVDHLQDNGTEGGPLFQPPSPDGAASVLEKRAAFSLAMHTPVGVQGWRRFWVAVDAESRFAGHVDLRSHPEPCTNHRALLGMGVHRTHRGRGLGTSLVSFAFAWAERETTLEFIDLEYLDGNLPAERLYQRMGFDVIARVPKMYRIDGRAVTNVMMTRAIKRG